MMEEVLLFLEFGLILNISMLIIDFILNIISASRMGFTKAKAVQDLWLDVLKTYRILKIEFEPILLFLETISIFIPFYYSWIVTKRLFSLRDDLPYFGFSAILKIEELEELENKYLI
jgi:hypothetical protein